MVIDYFLAKIDLPPYDSDVARDRKRGRGRPRLLKDPVSFTADLERADADALDALATKDGVSFASLVRKAVAAYLRRRGR